MTAERFFSAASLFIAPFRCVISFIMSSAAYGLAKKLRPLVEAITSFSPTMLRSVIEEGADLDHPLYTFHTKLRQCKEGESTPTDFGDEEMIALEHEGFVQPLHLAVICAYFAVKDCTSMMNTLPASALEVIDTLLERGANPTRGSGRIFVLNCQGYKWVSWDHDYPHNRPVNLAMYLKRYAWGGSKDLTYQMMDKVIQKLSDWESRHHVKQSFPQLR